MSENVLNLPAHAAGPVSKVCQRLGAGWAQSVRHFT